MSDPLSIAASVAGLLSLTIQVSQMLYTQVHVIKHAPGDAQDLLRELQAIEGALKKLLAFLREHRINEQDFGPNSMLTNAIQGCTAKILDIQTKIDKLNKHGLGSLIERGKWFYQKDERYEIVAILHRSLSIFQLSLSMEGMDLCLKSIQNFAQDIRGIQAAVELLSHNSLDKITELLVPLYETSTGVSQISSTIERWDSREQEREIQQMMDWLSPLRPNAKQADVLSRRQSGTGNWLVEHDVFKEWLNGTGSRLWCPGIPGAGKTVLSAVVVDHLHRTTNNYKTGIAFFYCSNEEQNAQNTVDILASLAQQLIRRTAPPPEELTTIYSYHSRTKTRPTLDECRSLLHALIQTLSQAVIILDALDEIDEKSGVRAQLITELRNLPPTTKLLITSRHCMSDEEHFEPSSRIEIRAPETDIATYVEARMGGGDSRLTKHFKVEPALEALILGNVVGQAKGMFLLPKLHMDALVKTRSRKEIKSTLNNLPKSLDNTYEDAMKRIASQEENDLELATNVLSWISYAVRPLSILELQHALATEFAEEEFDSEALIDQEILASVCGGLVSIDQKTSAVRLVHYTAQEYFERHRDRIFPGARTFIGRTCMAYLSFKTFSDDNLSLLSKLYTNDMDRKIALKQRHPLLDYTVHNWGIHVKGDLEQILLSQIRRLLENNGLLFELVYNNSITLQQLATYPHDADERTLKDISVLSIIAGFGLATVMETWLNERNSARRSKYRTPRTFEYAAEMVAFEVATLQQHEDVARLILRTRPGVVTALDKSGESLFFKLSCTENMMALRLLVKEETDLNAQARDGTTALSAAAKRKDDLLMAWLLENGANDILNQSDNTALCAVVSEGDFNKAKHLFDIGLRLNLTDDEDYILVKARYINYALCAAAKLGDVIMLEMLFDTAYDLDAPTDIALFDLWDDGGITTPLHLAAQTGQVETANFLIDKGLPISGETETGWTPLHWAAERGQLDVLLCLLNEGAKLAPGELQIMIDMKTSNSQTALHKAAAKRNYTSIVAALLVFRASVDLRMRNGNTALHIAAEKGNTDILSILVPYQEPKKLLNDSGLSARDLAIANGHQRCVELLSGEVT